MWAIKASKPKRGGALKKWGDEPSAEHLALFDIAKDESKGAFTQRPRRTIGLAVCRGWAKLFLERCRDLAEDPR